MPMRIPGRWREGFALTYYTVSSTYLGDDAFGHPMFDTKRSEIGELVYRLKYRSDSCALDELVGAAAGFVRSWNPGATVIVPVPPSRLSLIDGVNGSLGTSGAYRWMSGRWAVSG